MKKENLLKDITFIQSKLSCPVCDGDLDFSSSCCKFLSCGLNFQFKEGTYFFGNVYSDIKPEIIKYNLTDKAYWTPWRKANFDFLKSILDFVPSKSEIIDVGAGVQHFSELTKNFSTVALDFYPYTNIDVCLDFTKWLPFKKNTFDIAILSNVLEHIADPNALLSNLSKVLRPGGLIIAMVPFLISIHQDPYDFYRYTEFCLIELLNKNSFKMERLVPWGNPLTVAHGFIYSAQINYQDHFARTKSIFSVANLLMFKLFKKFIYCWKKWIEFSTKCNNMDSNEKFIGKSPFGYMFCAKKNV